jgi:putative peptidoglycan lipid II flippase
MTSVATAASSRAKSRARSTIGFAVAMAGSRVLGLAREILAARYFGVSGRMSAFTIAFQIPNLLRALFADSALQGAFIPVFSDLLERGKRREAAELAASLAILICLGLGFLSAAFMLIAPVAIDVLAPGFKSSPVLHSLTSELARVMFPSVILFSLSGLVAGILNSYDHFSAPAVAPMLWNGVVIVALVVFVPNLGAHAAIYAYAIGVVVATAVQLVYPLPWLRRCGFRLRRPRELWNANVRRVLTLMFPVTLTLGLFNLSLLVNALIGTLVSNQTPAAIDRAFRITVLPQGVFTLAISTVLFPALARSAARRDWSAIRTTSASGVRQICFFTLPSAAMLAALAIPITRLVYQHGAFDAKATHLVASALVIWALALPLQGSGTLLSQVFFGLQRPWVTAAIAGGYVLLNTGVGLALYGPLGIQGIIIGTVVANVAMTAGKGILLSKMVNGLEGRKNFSSIARMTAAAAAAAGASYAVERVIADQLGQSLGSQALSVGAALATGAGVYLALVLMLRVREASVIRSALVRMAAPPPS